MLKLSSAQSALLNTVKDAGGEWCSKGKIVQISTLHSLCDRGLVTYRRTRRFASYGTIHISGHSWWQYTITLTEKGKMV